jgi:signal transduction histidine kinase
VTTILLIEDNKGEALVVQKLLEKNPIIDFEVIHFSNLKDGIGLLKRANKIDVVLCDIFLPDSKGIQTVQKLRRVSSNLPVIFFTESKDEDLAIATIKKGAQDYLVKGQFEGEDLRRAITYSIERMIYQKEAEQAKARARKLKHDTNTLEKERVELVKLARAKDDFISLASHQLRTPATGVKQYINMLLQGFAGDLTSQQRQILEQANQSNERQLKIVRDLLKTAQLDSGKVELSEDTIDLVSLIIDIIEEQQGEFDARKQSIKFSNKSKSNIRIIADRQNLRMALENVVDNAGKYSLNNKSVKIDLTEGAKTVIIVVRDQGVGIDKRDLPKVFSKFSRVTNPLSDDVGGSGLGLYWAKNIIELHKGKIKVDSVFGTGTTFTITLPKRKKS